MVLFSSNLQMRWTVIMSFLTNLGLLKVKSLICKDGEETLILLKNPLSLLSFGFVCLGFRWNFGMKIFLGNFLNRLAVLLKLMLIQRKSLKVGLLGFVLRWTSRNL